MKIIQRPKSLTSIVIERLRESIIDGTIGLGALLSEKQVAESLGTSKTPVREAFGYLQSFGLIDVLPQKGGVVFQPSPQDVRDLCDVRFQLESLALRTSIEHDAAGLVDELSRIIAKMVDVYDVAKPMAYQKLDSELHLSFFKHCGNKLFADAYELFRPRICALRTHLSTPQPNLLNRSLEEHKMMLKLAKKRDVRRITLLLEEHINRTRKCHSEILEKTNSVPRSA